MTELKRIRLRHSPENRVDAILFVDSAKERGPIYFVHLLHSDGEKKLFICLNVFFTEHVAEAYLNKVANAIEIWEDPDMEGEEEKV